MEHRKIDPATMREMLKAADGMGVAQGRQDFQGEAVQFHPVKAFDTHFGKWAQKKGHIIAQVFPRAGKADVYYESRYTNEGRTYVPGRLEIRPQGLAFPKEMRKFVEDACHKVTFGDVQMDYVQELGAYVVKFCDVQPVDDWLKDGGLLEQFFAEVDRQLDPGGDDG